MKIITATFLLILFTSCNHDSSTSQPKQEITEGIVKELANNDSTETFVRTDSTLEQTSQRILESLKNEEYGKFATYIHPIKGVRFSPYAYVDTMKNIALSQKQFLPSFEEISFWGHYDGSGDSILLYTEEYIVEFVYNADFLHAEKVGVNEFISSGNSLNNLKEVYPDAVFTEHYFSGFNPEYEGMDWTTLRLVYEELNGELFLVGIIHDQWTI